MDRQAEGPVNGSERVKLHHNGAIDFIDRLGQWLASSTGCVVAQAAAGF